MLADERTPVARQSRFHGVCLGSRSLLPAGRN